METLTLTGYTTGLTLRLFPGGKLPNTDWATYKVTFAEGTGENVGIYSASVDETIASKWYAFIGDTAPSNWLDAIPGIVFDLTSEIAAAQATAAALDASKIPRAAAAVTAGASVRRTKVAATSATLDETLEATP